jgi:Tol biopolymer transport system component
MAFEPGTRLGPYEVLAPIGAGTAGTEERYKATDTRANRIVSLKVLPPELSGRPEMTERLERDARTISSLNHPNICALVEVVHQDPSTDFLVAEYVEGESLAQRLTHGPLELQEALKIAIAMADSLDKAHRQGVVHGGVNPSTVLLTTEGPKLLDFGVARLKEESQPAGAVSMAVTRASMPSLTSVPTAAAPYMAPEQFTGSDMDARTDIFAFGTVLYEMVTGRPAFQEKTLALLVAAVQSVDPDPVSKSQPMAPPALDHVVKRCLAKDPRQRLQTAWDLMAQLQWIAEGGGTGVGIPDPAAASRTKRDWAIWTALGAGLVLTASMAPSTWARFRSAPEPEAARFLASGLPTGTSTPLAISPNGRWLVTAPGGAAVNGVVGLSLNGVTPQVLIKDNNVTQPFWSPDSRSLGFFEGGKLKKAEISGGPAQNICEVTNPIGGATWQSDGVILFSAAGLIYRVAAAGGQPTAITALDKSKQETDHLGPYFLPDGRHYLFLAVAAESAIYLGSLDSKDRTRLFASDSKAIYAASTGSGQAAPGYVLFNRANTVFAQPFDPSKLALTGEPIRVADGVPLVPLGPNANPNLNRFASFAASQTGVLVFRTNQAAAQGQTGAADEQRSLSWFDRTGVRTASLGSTGAYAGLDLSPDGKRFVVHRHEGSGGDNWAFDLAQGRMQRLTFDASQDNQSPIWSPDGTRIAFSSRRNNKWGIYTKLADGTGTEELITESDPGKAPMSWSPDGKLLVYTQAGQANDVWAVPVAGDKKPFPLLQSPANEVFPQVSPDGKWLAYQSSETGRNEIYVKSFPEGPGKWQVSTDGGLWPRWRRDGKELYFVLAPNVWAAEIRVIGSSVQPGVPQTLFALGADPSAAMNHNPYLRFAVAGDGKSFLMSQPGTGGAATSGGLADQIAAVADRGGASSTAAAPNGVTVVLNWPQMLKKK